MAGAPPAARCRSRPPRPDACRPRSCRAREVLERGPHANLAVAANERRCLAVDDLRIGAEAAVQRADDRVGRIDVQVDHRRQVEIDAGLRGGCAAMSRPARCVTRGLPSAPSSAAETVGGKPWSGPRRATWPPSWSTAISSGASGGALARGRILEGGRQGGELLRRHDVAHRRAGRLVDAEQHHAAEAALADVGQHRRGRSGVGAAEADQEHLADLGAQRELDRGRRLPGTGLWSRVRRRPSPTGWDVAMPRAWAAGSGRLPAAWRRPTPIPTGRRGA